ncbi:hypothetical protein ASC95_26435 [Pelomonas sp. Root1217]|nr:hypothetical protein ASC95_26435 [Pelomonas sp. Root1217]
MINHACVLIEAGPVRLLTDPWLSGSAFNHGWELLAPTPVSIADLSFNYLWYSHEHPDHFAPAELLKIPVHARDGVTVLYQATVDGKVAEFCRSHGFKVLELEDDRRYELTDGIVVRCGQHRGSDSWLLIETPGGTILNLNDCYLPSVADAQALHARTGPIDVLLTQYSFANWIGNEGDDAYSRALANMYLRILANNLQVLAPRFTIPFASFTRFSSRENSHLNRFTNRVDQAVETIAANGSCPIALYVLDRWQLGDTSHDNTSAIAAWAAAARQPTSVCSEPPSVAQSDLDLAFERYVTRIAQKNDMAAIRTLSAAGCLPATRIHLTDLGRVAVLDICAGALAWDTDTQDFDIAMRSDSLSFLLRHEWGRGALQINGRFHANYATLRRFICQTQIAFMNNIGRSYPATIAETEVVNPSTFILRVVDRLHPVDA